ncbi:hypothetical protein DSM106972_085370 [Dulcicalothrix desertica PCC 7102]|uniref:DUF3696 domain-containing protein n=1 Tax=Dulcicalothrix desertica PCC 7102 TaxID=232991 RepID=A0A433UT77_9CYAN|nr:DUF3696 domain-containing protein [Dulcicalothrix desertica]RUS96987.1 hypothetical protein DSM106972_085370 [Dulcicalothrix desertica PCC 7102]TWH53959.1 putative ATPase [Dulcicalothrix desertica PCC 7102]
MIHSLLLRNFTVFEEQLLKFCPLTLVSGFNNTGKSSSLKSLLLLRQSYLQGVLSERLALNGDLVYLETLQDIFFEGAKDKFIEFEIFNHNQEKRWQWRFAYDLEANVLETKIAPAISEIDKFCLFGSSFHYLQAERISSFNVHDSVVRQDFQIGTKGEYTAHFLSVFGDWDINTVSLERKNYLQEVNIACEYSEQSTLNKLSHPQAKSICLKDQVGAWISEISSGNKICITSNEDIDSSSPQYSFEIKNHNSKKYHSTNVGFGISSTLPIVVALLASPPGSLIIIEHPEAHLHPSGQTKIGKLIALAASSGIQVVIETHSDHILNGIRLSVHGGLIKPDDVQLNYFQRRETKDKVVTEVISPSIDRNGRIDRWPDGFFDELEKNLVVLLKPAGH